MSGAAGGMPWLTDADLLAAFVDAQDDAEDATSRMSALIVALAARLRTAESDVPA